MMSPGRHKRSIVRNGWLNVPLNSLTSNETRLVGGLVWRMTFFEDSVLKLLGKMIPNVVYGLSSSLCSPKCRARIWRSEVEASINQSDYVAGNLEERRKNRKPCTCPPKDRPQD
jgi:hypothetical protein